MIRGPLFDLRRRAGYAHAIQVAKLLRITKYHMSDIEVGRAKPSAALVARLAKLYGTSQREVRRASITVRLAFLERSRADLQGELEQL